MATWLLAFCLCIFYRISYSQPIFGLYHGAAPYSPNNFPAYESWLGRKIYYGTDFMRTDGGFTALQGESWQLSPWSTWVNGNASRYLVLSIPMVPNGGENEIVNGSKGLHNATWKALATNLVHYNLTRTILRIGWEMNGNWQPWKASTNTTAWVKYFQIMVAVMRSVYSGFKVIWNPNAGYTETDATTIWPGDSYVDIVGLDTYDSDWNSALPSYNLNYPSGATQRGTWNVNASYNTGDIIDWQGTYYRALNSSKGKTPPSPPTNNTYWQYTISSTQLAHDRTQSWLDYYSGYQGLVFWSNFAKQHNKRFGICEWGVWLQNHGGGDNPYYIQQMYNFISNSSNSVYYYSYFDVFAYDGDHALAPNSNLPQLPNSAAKFKTLFA